MITTDQINFYHNNGYLIIKDFFSKEEINDYNNMFILVLISYVKKCNSDHNTNYIINNIKINDNSIDKALDFLEEKDHKYISMIYDTLSETPAFLRIKSKIYYKG